MAKRVIKVRRRGTQRAVRRVPKRESTARLMRSVENLERQIRRLGVVSDKALRQFESIRLDGATRREEQIVRQAVKDGLLTDLAALERELLSSAPNLASFRSVPTALLIWATTELHLEPIMKIDDEGEMSSGATLRYDWTGPSPTDQGIVAFRVVDPGWKWQGRVLARPKLALRK